LQRVNLVDFLQNQLDTAEITRKEPIQVSSARQKHEIDELDGKLTDLESRLLQMNSSLKTLSQRYLELTELRHVLRETAIFFESAESKADDVLVRHSEDMHLLGVPSQPARETDLDAIERGGKTSSIG
jgi:V-type H+-transporting ATPase subunit a